MTRPSRMRPRELVAGEWPEGKTDDAAARAAQEVARRLSTATMERGLRLRDVEAATGVDHSTVGNVLNGEVWADIATLARLETGLGIDLWPHQAISA